VVLHTGISAPQSSTPRLPSIVHISDLLNVACNSSSEAQTDDL